MSSSGIRLLDPLTQELLLFESVAEGEKYGILSGPDSVQKWPVILGISFLRSDRSNLALQVAELVLKNDFVSALATLLMDTDDFAPAKPQMVDCRKIAQCLIDDDKELLAVDMMQALQFGPVADYFALRGSAPTFFSGLGLLKLGVVPEQPLIEIGCGVGHFLYWLNARGIKITGTDSVFSKLCIAHRFLGIQANHLVCAVAGKRALPLQTFEATNIFCHDAFYFINDKFTAIADFRRLALGGHVMVGHAHLSTANHGIVSGFPSTTQHYRLVAAENAHFFDDESLTLVDQQETLLRPEITDQTEAISFIEGSLSDLIHEWWLHEYESLFVPMEVSWSDRECMSKMNWPSEAFAQEYKSSHHLVSPHNPFEFLPLMGDVKSLPFHPGLAIPLPFFTLGIRPLRWGVIGGGWIAADYFVPAFQHTPLAQLVAVCDTHSERCGLFSKLNGVQTFSSWHNMFESCDLDAVYIATPNFTHAEIFEAAAHQNIRILCEKPLATNSADLDKIKNSALYNPSFYQTAFDQRYHPAHINLARRIKSGDLGIITQIKIHYACWVDDNWNKVPATENWRIDPLLAGGGAGFDLLPHCLDLILMLVDDSVETCHLIYQNRVHEYAIGRHIDDGAILSFRTNKGILASVHVGYNCPENQPRRRIDVMGTIGCVEAINTMGQDPGGDLNWLIDGKKSHDTFPSTIEAGPFVRQLEAISRQWIKLDPLKYPFERDIFLAECLVASDIQAKKNLEKVNKL